MITGIRPVERTMNAVLTSYVAVGKTVYAAPAESYELKVTPEAPVIESAYYINGSLTWEQNVAFVNTSGDPYTNSVFTTTVPALVTDNTGAKDAYFLIKSNSGKSLGAVDADNDAPQKAISFYQKQQILSKYPVAIINQLESPST